MRVGQNRDGGKNAISGPGSQQLRWRVLTFRCECTRMPKWVTSYGSVGGAIAKTPLTGLVCCIRVSCTLAVRPAIVCYFCVNFEFTCVEFSILL